MVKWPKLLFICLSCSSFFMLGGQAAGASSPVAQHSIQATQGGIPTTVVVSLNTTEIFAFSSGKVILNIMADGDGVLLVNVTNVEGAIIPTSTNVTFTNLNQTYEVPFNPSLGVLPGTFSLQVAAWYVNGSVFEPVLSGTVNVRLGMGVILGIPILLTVAVIAIILAIKLRKPAGTKKVEAEKTKSSTEGTAGTSGVANKIRCPECKKLIDEGSVFCAECGARVPEFLRYNTPQN